MRAHRGKELLERLAASVLVADGAMGTMLYARGIYVNRCFDEVNLSQPDLVRGIPRDYLATGAELLETNTFGANRFKLRGFGLDDKVREINEKGARLAREVAGERAFVAGSVGPLGRPVDPSLLAEEAMSQAFAEQIEALCEGGVDGIILETQNNIAEMRLAAQAARRVAADVPVILLATFAEEGLTLGGESPEQVVSALEPLVDVIGANCSQGPSDMLDTVCRLCRVARKPVAAMPNAGAPRLVDHRFVYLTSPEYLAEYTRRFITAGVSLVGGCCGTTPAHIAAVSAMVRAMKSQHAKPRGSEACRINETQEQASGETQEPALSVNIQNRASISDAASSKALDTPPEDTRGPLPTASKSSFASKLGHSFVVSIELSPPHGVDVRRALEHARLLKAAGVDVVNIPDGPRASARLSPLGLAEVLRHEVGLESIIHFTCRDRNLLGLQADFLAAHVLGHHNVLLVTGDPPKLGDYPNLTAVFDVDSVGLVRMVAGLNKGRDLAGTPIGTPTNLLIGVGANPGAEDFEREVARFAAKVQAGAEFVMTQPVYDPRHLERFLDAIRPYRIPVLVGILPLASYRNAEFLHNEVPGMQIPEAIRERMRRAPTGEAAAEEGIRIAKEALRATRALVEGVYIMPPLGKVAAALRVLEALGE